MNIEPLIAFKRSRPNEPIGISLTDSAEWHIAKQLNDRGGVGVRFAVEGAGCGGYSYVVEFVDQGEEHDHVFEHNSVSIFVDKKSILFIDGMIVDFVTDGFSSGLEFSNPLAGITCGCGESFTMAV